MYLFEFKLFFLPAVKECDGHNYIYTHLNKLYLLCMSHFFLFYFYFFKFNDGFMSVFAMLSCSP